MATIHTLDRSKGLDLILHTPGGDIAATESIVHYIRQMFGLDVRAIIPQIAMFAQRPRSEAGRKQLARMQPSLPSSASGCWEVHYDYCPATFAQPSALANIAMFSNGVMPWQV